MGNGLQLLNEPCRLLSSYTSDYVSCVVVVRREAGEYSPVRGCRLLGAAQKLTLQVLGRQKYRAQVVLLDEMAYLRCHLCAVPAHEEQ
jgi:hypothetical protein